MAELSVDEFVRLYAPVDVQETVAWLLAHGYVLTSRVGDGSFGAQFVFAGGVEVRITVDRGQWLLDVAPRPGQPPWSFDLLLAARSGQEYGQLFPVTGRLPKQLPDGVSWLDSLPDMLTWVGGDGVEAAVDRAMEQRRARI